MDIALAASTGDVRGVESSLRKGVNPDTTDAEGNTPLWLATKRGHQEIVEILLEAGASPDTPAPNGFSPLHRSASEGFQGITEALLRAGANVDVEHSATGVTPLFTAISTGKLASVARLLVAGAYPEHRRKDSGVPLHWAAYFGHAAIVELLLENGADADSTNANGQTPLDVATDPKVREILERGTDIVFDEDEDEGRRDVGRHGGAAKVVADPVLSTSISSPPPSQVRGSRLDVTAATPRTVERVREMLSPSDGSRHRGEGNDELGWDALGENAGTRDKKRVILAGRRANVR